MQQVNLYQPILRKQEKVFSAKTLLQGNLMVLLGLMLLYGYTSLQTRTMQSRLTQVEQQRDTQAMQLVTLTKQYPVRARDNSLKGRIEQAETELQHKRALLAAVEGLGQGTGVGFSEHLAGLARQDLPQLWLRRIYLQHDKRLELDGSAYQADEVPVYLQRLTAEQPFIGTNFLSVVIARNEERQGLVDFTLSTQPLEEKK